MYTFLWLVNIHIICHEFPVIPIRRDFRPPIVDLRQNYATVCFKNNRLQFKKHIIC